MKKAVKARDGTTNGSSSVRRCASRAHVSTGWNESHVEGLKLYGDVSFEELRRKMELQTTRGELSFTNKIRSTEIITFLIYAR